jgi:tetratricopeptide (TPR) repeat protein
MAKLHQARGYTQLYREQLSEAIALNPSLLTARLELVQVLLVERSAKAAMALLNETPQAQKMSLPVIVQRNWTLLALRDLDQLRKELDQHLQRARLPDFLIQDAYWKYSQKDLAGARRSLEEVLKNNPEDLRALNMLTSILFRQKQVPELLASVRASVAARPQSAPLKFLLAQWLERAGDRQGARAALAAAKAADPTYRLAPLALSRLDILDGKTDPAHQALTGLIAADPSDLQSRLTLGMLEDKLGNYPAAIEHYRKVLAKDPKNIIALNNLAYRLTEDGKSDEALMLAQQAKGLAPEDPYVATTIGWVLYQKGAYQTALQNLEAAVAKETTPLRQYYLAMTYFKVGNRQRGEQVLRQALKLDPKLPQAKVALEVAQSSRPEGSR